MSAHNPRVTTLRKIAKEANVSIATVSRVVNNSDGVGPDARRAVEEAMRILEYEPRRAVRASTRGRKIGVLVADIVDAFYPPLVRGISDGAMSRNVEVVLCDLARDPRIESYWLETLRERRVDGIIQAPAGPELNPATLKLIEERFPVVLLLDHAVAGQDLCVVTTDNEVGAYHAAKYLIDLGHREILFLSGPTHLNESVAREQGYRRALAEADVRSAGGSTISCDGSMEDAYRIVRAANTARSFTAIIALSDVMAAAAWKALTDEGVRVPEDVSLIGYNDTMVTRILSLTTVAQPTRDIGRHALALLLDLINGRREPPQRVEMRDSLIIRNSCRKL